MVKRKTLLRLKNCWPYYLLMLPGLIYFLVNNYLPLSGIIIAFKNINYSIGWFASPWTGVKNFEFLFTFGSLYTIIRNTVLYNAAFIVLGTVFSVATAIFLNEVRSKTAGRIFQTLILLPYLMSMVVVSYLVYAFLSVETGYINNSILPLFGIEPIAFYYVQGVWPFILTFVNLWKSVGFSGIVYYAAVLGISEELFEAARVDGAGKLQQIFRITIPCIKPTIITMFILSVSKIFFSDFGLFYHVPKNSGILYLVTQTIDTYVYNALMNNNNPGMSGAVGLFQSVVGFIMVVAANALIRRTSSENALF